MRAVLCVLIVQIYMKILDIGFDECHCRVVETF